MFTGGVGEHAPEIRAAACEPFGFAGVALALDANATLDGEGEIGASGLASSRFRRNGP